MDPSETNGLSGRKSLDDLFGKGEAGKVCYISLGPNIFYNFFLTFLSHNSKKFFFCCIQASISLIIFIYLFISNFDPFTTPLFLTMIVTFNFDTFITLFP